MKKAKISIIAAIGENRELGKDNKLLWHIPEDLKRFKKLTQGHAVIMGRKTYESIGRPLPNRTNIIVTRDKQFRANGCIVTYSIEEAINFKFEILNLKFKDEVFVIGGGQIYTQALPYADKLYLTIVEGTFEADTFFPDCSAFKKILHKESKKFDNYQFTFLDLEK